MFDVALSLEIRECGEGFANGIERRFTEAAPTKVDDVHCFESQVIEVLVHRTA